MNFFIDANKRVHALEADGSQNFLIQEDWREMTAEEIDRHKNPENYMTAQERRQIYLQNLPPLTRRQFKLTLLNNDLLTKVAETIATIEDPVLRSKVQIEYEDSDTFYRLNPTLEILYKALGLKEAQVDRMWEEGLKL